MIRNIGLMLIVIVRMPVMKSWLLSPLHLLGLRLQKGMQSGFWKLEQPLQWQDHTDASVYSTSITWYHWRKRMNLEGFAWGDEVSYLSGLYRR